MRLSPPPNLRSNCHLAIAALAATSIANIGLVWHADSVTKTLGGPDDAMRLVLVRDLLSGGDWYDQLITRLQPPTGVFLHWSRLLDGVLAAVTKGFEIVLAPNAAEATMRLIWPLLWTLPAIWCALVIARRLGGSLAAFICAILLASNQEAFAQFVPGRIDHHNIQIVMTLIAVACALSSEHGPRWAILGGISTALGLAIGIEALPFHLIIGASYALRAVIGDEKRAARYYALSLLGAAVLFYCIQTPPWRWSMSFCDAIGLNLIVGITIAAAGLAILATERINLSARGRILGLALTGLIATAAYLALDPACVGGPLSAVDPRIRPFWFNIVDEMLPLPRIFERFWDLGINLFFLSALLIVAIILMFVRNWPRIQAANLLISALVILAVGAGFEAFRMESYVFWLGFPLLSTELGILAAQFLGGLMVPTALVSVLLSPVGVEGVVIAGSAMVKPHNAVSHQLKFQCFDTAEYDQLKTLPPGLVLADISMGPFILANTQDAVLNAPYHRMIWGILTSHYALTATSAAAESKIRSLKVDYLVECQARPLRPTPGTIESDLAHGKIPDWLQPLSAKDQLLQIYRVRS